MMGNEMTVENWRTIPATDADLNSLTKTALVRLIMRRWGMHGFTKHDVEWARAEIMQEIAMARMEEAQKEMQGLHGWENREAYHAASARWSAAQRMSDRAFKLMDKCNGEEVNG